MRESQGWLHFQLDRHVQRARRWLSFFLSGFRVYIAILQDWIKASLALYYCIQHRLHTEINIQIIWSLFRINSQLLLSTKNELRQLVTLSSWTKDTEIIFPAETCWVVSRENWYDDVIHASLYSVLSSFSACYSAVLFSISVFSFAATLAKIRKLYSR